MRFNLGLLLALVLVTLSGVAAWGDAERPSAEVRLGGQRVLTVPGAVGEVTAAERARLVEARVRRGFAAPGFSAGQIEAGAFRNSSAAVRAGGQVLIVATPDDAAAAGAASPRALAEEWATAFRKLAERGPPPGQPRSLSDHQLALLILQLLLLLVAARAGGEIAARLGQPAVIGQLLAGVLIGKSVLGALFPPLAGLVAPADPVQSQFLDVVSKMGALFLLLLVGLETDLALIRAQGRPAACASVTGLLLPFALGYGVTLVLPESLFDGKDRILIALFLGTALSESSVPVIARILNELQLLRRNVGQVILATALLQDTVGWIALAAIAGLVRESRVSMAAVMVPLGGMLLLGAVALTVGRRGAQVFLRWVNDHARGEQAMLAALLILMFLGAAASEQFHIHAIIGAFLIGVMLAGLPLVTEKLIHPLEVITTGFLAPIFFAAAGLNVDLAAFRGLDVLLAAGLLLAAACAGKIIGGYAGGRWGGLTGPEALSLGLGTNARGALGILIAVLGLSLGVLNAKLFSILIVVALVTTAMTPPLLRWSLKRVRARPEEEARLAREAAEAGSFMSRLRRVLISTSGGPDALLAARLLRAVGAHRPLEVTALHVATPRHPDAEEALAPVSAALEGGQLTVVRRTATAAQTAIGIARESGRGYDLLALGCGPGSAPLEEAFGRAASHVAREVEAPLLMVRAPDVAASTGPPRRILVPTTGMLNSLQAAELGIAVARGAGAQVTVLHVVEGRAEVLLWLARQARETEQQARELAAWVAHLAEPFGVEVEARVRAAPHAAPEIVQVAGEVGADLILLGGELRATHRLFMGHTISYVMEHASCAVAVLKT